MKVAILILLVLSVIGAMGCAFLALTTGQSTYWITTVTFTLTTISGVFQYLTERMRNQ